MRFFQQVLDVDRNLESYRLDRGTLFIQRKMIGFASVDAGGKMGIKEVLQSWSGNI